MLSLLLILSGLGKLTSAGIVCGGPAPWDGGPAQFPHGCAKQHPLCSKTQAGQEVPSFSQSIPSFKVLLHLVVGGPKAGPHLPDPDPAPARKGALLPEREGKRESLDEVLRPALLHLGGAEVTESQASLEAVGCNTPKFRRDDFWNRTTYFVY